MPIVNAAAPPTESVKKSIRFTAQTHHAIEQTAANLGFNFSRTVELLVQLGLQDTHSLATAELLRTTADQGVSRALNRYLKLVSQVVIAANEAKEMAQLVFLVQLSGLTEKISDPVQINRALSLDPDSEIGSALIETYKQRQQRSRNRAVRQLKRAINIDDALWDQLTKWGRDDDEI